jgi:drug/metabolite transporter (DMT)-like permease
MTGSAIAPRSPQATWLRACGTFLCALLALATLDMLAKDLVGRHPAPLVNLFRYGVVLAMAAAMMRARKCPLRLQRRHRALVLWRGVALGGVGLTFMQALRTMPLAEATAIYFLSPLMIVALSRLLLREHVGPGQIAAVVAGFLGMLLIVRPGSDLPLAGTALMLVAAGSYAMLQILTRKLAGQVRMEQQFFWAAVMCTAMTLLSLPAAGPMAWPAAGDIMQLGLVGLLSGLGQYLLIKAFQQAPASSLAPFNYFHLVLAVAFSVLVFGRTPDAIALAGMAIIALSGLSLMLPGFRRHVAATLAARRPPPPAAAEETS